MIIVTEHVSEYRRANRKQPQCISDAYMRVATCGLGALRKRGIRSILTRRVHRTFSLPEYSKVSNTLFSNQTRIYWCCVLLDKHSEHSNIRIRLEISSRKHTHFYAGSTRKLRAIHARRTDKKQYVKQKGLAEIRIS